MKDQLTVIENKPVSATNIGNTVMDRLLVAATSGMDIAVLEKFMDLAERNEKREAEKAFHKAFAAFKTDPPQIVKDKLVNFTNNAGKQTKYKHATIGAVVGAIISGMSRYGLSHRWNVSQDSKTITVSCHITHELGHTETTALSAGADESGGKNAIQAIASTVTYLERYTLQAATGIAVLEADDDGGGAEGITQPPKKQGKKQEEKLKEDRTVIEAWLKAVDDYIPNNGTPAQLDAWWAAKVNPIINKFIPAHRNELEVAFKDTMKFLQERDGVK